MIMPMTMSTDATSTRRPLWQRVAIIVTVLLLGVVIPTATASIAVGPLAATATILGIAGGLAGSIGGGWRRALACAPLAAILGTAVAIVGYGWGWVVVMGLVGVLAGFGVPSGALPAILFAGFVPMAMTQASGVLAAVFVGCFALLGCVLGVVMARRMGARAKVPGPDFWRGHEGLAALLAGAAMAGGSAVAVAMGLPHGYWVPLTLIIVVAALSQGDKKKGPQRLVGSVGAMIITIPLSFLPLPGWAFYVVALLLLVPALVMYKKNYGIYAFLESAAVVLLVSSRQDIGSNADARAIAAVIAVAIISALALVARAVFAWLPDVTDPAAVDRD